MHCFIIKGSPRKAGNTNALLDCFRAEWERLGHTDTAVDAYDSVIGPCIACRECQKDWSVFGCWQKDDMQKIFDGILRSDLILIASPIYSWYCTPPVKAILDRLVYGMNKYYGDEKGPALWSGKPLAVLTTCGYRPEQGADLFGEGMRRYCKHSQLRYLGMLAERHLGYRTEFMTPEKAEHAAAFARQTALALSPDGQG